MYLQTIRELETWYPLLKPGGFIILRDANFFCQQQLLNATPQSGGGVFRALCEWKELRRVPALTINNFLGPLDKAPEAKNLVYKDITGLALLQKQC